MKVAVVSPYPPGWRGIGEYGRVIARGMAALDEGVQVVVLAERVPGAPAEELDGKAQVRRVWRRNRLDTAAVILRCLRDEQPEVVWFNVGLAVFGRGVAALLALSTPALAKAAGFRTVVTLHEVIDAVDVQAIGAPLGRVGRAAVGWATRLLLTADTVCVTLDAYRGLLREKYGRADAVHVPHGSMAPLPPLPSRPQEHGTRNVEGTRRAQGINRCVPCSVFPVPPGGDEGGRVVMLANQAPHKGLDLLLEAHARLLPQHPGLDLVVAGDDHPRFPGYLAGMRRRWGHLPGVRWAGYLDETALAAVLDAATVVAIPSRATTGASSVLARAAAHGRALAAADLPDLRAAARENGLAVQWFPAGSVEGLMQALTVLLTDAEKRRAMEAHNRAAGQQHTLMKAVAVYHDLFVRLAARRVLPQPAPSRAAHGELPPRHRLLRGE